MFFLFQNNGVIFKQQVIFPSHLLCQLECPKMGLAATNLAVSGNWRGNAGDLFLWEIEKPQLLLDVR